MADQEQAGEGFQQVKYRQKDSTSIVLAVEFTITSVGSMLTGIACFYLYRYLLLVLLGWMFMVSMLTFGTLMFLQHRTHRVAEDAVLEYALADLEALPEYEPQDR